MTGGGVFFKNIGQIPWFTNPIWNPSGYQMLLKFLLMRKILTFLPWSMGQKFDPKKKKNLGRHLSIIGRVLFIKGIMLGMKSFLLLLISSFFFFYSFIFMKPFLHDFFMLGFLFIKGKTRMHWTSMQHPYSRVGPSFWKSERLIYPDQHSFNEQNIKYCIN